MADWCAREIAKIADFAARHEAPGGAGWTDIYIRPPAPASLAGLVIPLAQAAEAIGSHLPRFDEVVSGSFASPTAIRGALGYGPSSAAAVVLIGDNASRHTRSMTLILRAGRADAAAVLAALAGIPSPEPLMVVDWHWASCVRLAHPHEVDGYLARLE